MASVNAWLLILLFQVVGAASTLPSALWSRPASILLPPLAGKTGAHKLLLLVPVAPSKDYTAMATAIQKESELRLSVSIAVCTRHVPIYNVTLCDSYELGPILHAAIAAANTTAKGAFDPRDVFVGGHSMGGMLARQFVDTEYTEAGGVLFFGTQYTGDSENPLKGFLGYPANLTKYPTPLLAMAGELDKMSIDNLAPMVQQWSALTAPYRYLRYPVVIPGTDESQYCSPYHLRHDLLPAIKQSDALSAVGAVTGAWLDYVAGDTEASSRLNKWTADTLAATAPFLGAVALDKEWCEAAQRLIPNVPRGTQIEVVKVPGYKLDSCHTKYVVNPDGSLKLTLCDYTSYIYHNQPPWEAQYAGAVDIACKFIGEDRIAQLLQLPLPDMKAPAVLNRCQALNTAAFEAAKALVTAKWPRAVDRFTEHGKAMLFRNDTQTHAGPQWLMEGFGFSDDDDSVAVQGIALITTVGSLIYPGAHYCKLLSPSKAVDIIMTMGLTKRFK